MKVFIAVLLLVVLVAGTFASGGYGGNIGYGRQWPDDRNLRLVGSRNYGKGDYQSTGPAYYYGLRNGGRGNNGGGYGGGNNGGYGGGNNGGYGGGYSG